MPAEDGYDGFTPFRGPDFELQCPAGWNVQEDERGLITLDAGEARLEIWPVMVEGTVGDRGAALLRSMAGQLRAEMDWSEVTHLAAHVWSAQAGDRGGGEAGFARLVLGAPTPEGQPAWLYLASVPDASWLAQVQPLAEQVFRSYRPVAPDEGTVPGGEQPTAASRFRRQVEPTEGAFEVSVPREWSFEAGLVRHGVYTQPWYRLRAADGSEIRSADPRLPLAHLEPSATTQFMGRPVGSIQEGVMIRPFVPPPAFAAEYGGWMAQELGLGEIAVTQQLGPQEAMAAMSAPFRQRVEKNFRDQMALGARTFPQARMQPLVGAASFTSTRSAGGGRSGGEEWAGFIYALGTASQIPGAWGSMQTWSLQPVGFAGPVSRRAELQDILHEVGASLRVNPRWQQHQEQAILRSVQHEREKAARENARIRAEGEALVAAAERSRIQAENARLRTQNTYNPGETFSEISDISHQGYVGRQQSSNEMHRREVNVIHEQVDIRNPVTGQVSWGVPGHANHYFVDTFGNTVGTELDENPDPFRFVRGQNLDDLYDTGGS